MVHVNAYLYVTTCSYRKQIWHLHQVPVLACLFLQTPCSISPILPNEPK